MGELIKRVARSEKGQGMGEYALILALIAIGVVVTLGTVGTAIRSKLQEITDRLNNANPG